MTCRRYIVSGRVQGVFFRASTQEQAEKLGLTGWVKNRRDGKVEALACGSRQQLEQFETWISNGPPMASVSDITVKPFDDDPIVNGFNIKYE
jgi:acylphosphatase